MGQRRSPKTSVTALHKISEWRRSNLWDRYECIFIEVDLGSKNTQRISKSYFGAHLTCVHK